MLYFLLLLYGRCNYGINFEHVLVTNLSLEKKFSFGVTTGICFCLDLRRLDCLINEVSERLNSTDGFLKIAKRDGRGVGEVSDLVT